MKITLRVLPPPGRSISPDLIHRLRRVLTGIEVGFTLEASSAGIPTICLIDSSDPEARFVQRILQRAGYDVEISL